VSVESWVVTRFGEPRDVLSLRAVETRPLGEGEVRVSVAANGLNFLDASICRGTHPLRPSLPFVLGAELVGTVDEVADGITSVAPGDRVVAISPNAHGCFAREAVVPEGAVLPVPASIPDTTAAALLVTYQTAHLCLHRRGRLRPGEWVLVTAAAGGLGTALIQLAKTAGARVIAVTGSTAKVDLCRAQGADVVIDHRAEALRDRVMEVTGGSGVDIVCDSVGGTLFQDAVACLALEGRILPVGWSSGEPPMVDAGSLVARNADLVGVSWGSTYPGRLPGLVRKMHTEIVALVESGAISPVIRQVWDAQELPTALQALGDGGSVGKGVVRWP
jgi:NADPH2:quinone reductase